MKRIPLCIGDRVKVVDNRGAKFRDRPMAHVGEIGVITGQGQGPRMWVRLGGWDVDLEFETKHLELCNF